MKLNIRYKVRQKLFENESEFLKITGSGNRIFLHASVPVQLQEAVLYLEYDAESKMYCNGFQTWTDAGTYRKGESVPHLKLPARLTDPIFRFRVVGDYAWCPQDALVSHTYTYLSKRGRYRLLGALNERTGFTSFHFKKKLEVRKDVEGLIVSGDFLLFDIFEAEGTKDEVLDAYFAALNIAKPRVPYVLGYTSWYRHYQDISEAKLLHDLQSLTSLKGYQPELFQIDDGYETAVGDWLSVDASKFPSGFAPLVRSIHEKGLIAGLWLAPFVAEKKSDIRKRHPEWIVMRGASNWSGMYHLDITLPEVKAYLHEVFAHYKALGFRFFKLDFLYAACSVPLHGKSRAMLMYEAMDFLREELRDCYILGCGVPLGSAFGKVDYCRIGQDVSLEDDGPWYMRLCHRERVSTRLAIRNTIARAHLDHRAFGNDPDVFILRKVRLSEAVQKQLFETNAAYGSLLLTSDDIAELPVSQQEALIDLSRRIQHHNRQAGFIPLTEAMKNTE